MKLTSRMRQASHDLHVVAEKSGMMPVLLRGQLATPHYAVYLRNVQAIYAALEQGLAQPLALPAGAAQIDFTALLRSNALAQDLAFLALPTEAPLCAATLDYVQRLQALGAAHSALLLGHAYVRYLGDLHGGQLMRRCVARMLQTDGTEGVHFYNFGSPAHVATLIDALRSAVDCLPLEEAQAQAIAQEARLGFDMHIALFQQLPHAPLA
jgi:heme oxygenase